MKILWLFLFVGIIQCDDQSISPAEYNGLCVPNTVEYISVYTLSVQTSYITSVECMLSSNYYIKSGFSEIDSSTNDITSNIAMVFEDVFKSLGDMFTGLNNDLETDMKNKLDSVLFMTVNYYMKQDVTVEEKDLSLGSATDATCAKSILTAQRCESSYNSFMSEIDTLKSKYTSETSSTSSVSESDWACIVKNYYEARTEIDRKTNVYASIRDAFLYGSGIDLCQGSINKDQKLLDIYKCDDLLSFFSISDQNDASELFNKTVLHMYTIYKTSLTVIYLNSVAYSDNDLALRTLVWEQLNSVRANFEYMSQNILTFMHGVQDNAESKLDKDSDEYNKAMIDLYKSVHKLLVTIVKTTEVHYQRSWNFDSPDTVMETNYNSYNIDVLTKYYNSILWKNANVANFDMRMVDNSTKSNSSADMVIPQNMYSMEINKLVFQTFLCDLNYVLVKMRTSLNDETDSSTWKYNLQITIKEMECAVIFAKCSAINNKIYCMNAATYSYIVQKTSSSTTSTSTTNTQITDITQIMNQISTDVIGTLCINTKEITEIFHEVEIYVNQNCKANSSSINYQPGFKSYTGNNPNSGSPPSSNSNGTNVPPPTGSTGTPSTPSIGSYSPPPSNSNGTNVPPPTDSTGTPSTPSTGSYSPPPTNSTGTPSTPSTGSYSPPPTNSTGTPSTPSTGSYSPPPSNSNGTNVPPPTGSTGTPSTPSTGGSYSPPPTNSTGTPSTPSTGSYSPPPSNSNGTNVPPPTGSTGTPSTPSTGSYSPPPTNSTGTPSTPSTGSYSPPPSNSNGTNVPPPTGSTGTPSTPSTGSYSPPPTNSTGTPSTPSTGSYSPPPSNSNGTNVPPPIGSTGTPSTPSTGSYSPPPSNSNGTNVPPPTGSTGTPSTPSTGSYSPPPTNSTDTPITPSTGSYSPLPSSSTGIPSTPSTGTTNTPSTSSSSSYRNTYFSIKSTTQILQSIEYFSSSVTEQFSSSISTIQSTQETDYTKTVTSSLSSCQEQFQYNIDYLNSITTKSEEFISQYTTSGSNDYTMALTAIYKDTEEKKAILSSFLEISFRRANDYPLDSDEYLYVQQTITYTEYVKQFYKFFNIDSNEVYNTNNDADSYLTMSVTKFSEIHETVTSAVKATPDDSYKEYLLWELDETVTVFKQTTDSLKTYISQSQSFISQSSSSSQSAFYIEITQRMETIYAVYSAVLIKGYQYAQSTTSVTIYESEYDVVVTQTSVTTSYTEESSSSSSYSEVETSPISGSESGLNTTSSYSLNTTETTLKTLEVTVIDNGGY